MNKHRTGSKKVNNSARCDRTRSDAALSAVSTNESAFLSSLSAEEFNGLLEERSDIARGL